MTAVLAPEGTCERGARHGSVAVWCRFLRCSRARVRPAGGTRARRGSGEDRGAERLRDGAAWALPARARRWPALMSAPARERVQGPGRGDRGTDRGAASPAPARWSGRPCGRSLRKCCGPAEGGATARAPAGLQPRSVAHWPLLTRGRGSDARALSQPRQATHQWLHHHLAPLRSSICPAWSGSCCPSCKAPRPPSRGYKRSTLTTPPAAANAHHSTMARRRVPQDPWPALSVPRRSTARSVDLEHRMHGIPAIIATLS